MEFTATDTIDADYVTTRTFSGCLRNDDKTLVPPINEGFRREQISAVTSPDGTETKVVIVDKQIAK